MRNLHKYFYDTALSAGIPLIASDKCCQLLAWLYVYGGANEQVVFDDRLREAIFYAQKRLNIEGGEITDQELTPVLQYYIKSIVDFKKPPDWVINLENEYGIKGLYRGK